jgi:hypothetical protein
MLHTVEYKMQDPANNSNDLSEFYVVPIMREVEAQHLYRE